MADRLRELIDLVLESLDERADGRALADRAHFSRDHLDRLLAAATGSRPWRCAAGCCWSARRGSCARARRRPRRRPRRLVRLARGVLARVRRRPRRAAERLRGLRPPRRARRAERDPLPPAGRPPRPGSTGAAPRGWTSPTVSSPTISTACASCSRPPRPCRAEALERALRPGLVVVWFEGEEASAAVMAERLVFTLEVWVAAISGEPHPEPAGRDRAAAVRRRRPRLRPPGPPDPGARRVGRRLRRRAVRAAAVVHLRRRRSPTS